MEEKSVTEVKDDSSAWMNCHIDDLWIFDKLLLSKKLGYSCGPGSVPVPQEDFYVIRPITNLYGMGAGAKRKFLTQSTAHLVPPGYFWCEQFVGRHLSVDYDENYQQIRCVEGFRDIGNPLYKFDEWIQVEDKVEFPPFLKKMHKLYKNYNVEFIGNKIIEVHLRSNPDPVEPYLEVVWESDEQHPEIVSVDNADGYIPEKRLGFRT